MIRFGVKTNVTHREWIYRQTYLLGRHIIGYEVQSVLSAVDLWSSDSAPVVVGGTGEGGMLALMAGALDPRIDAVYVEGYFGPREGVWSEPLYRSVSGLLAQMGDAEMASLIAPRPLVIQSRAFPRGARAAQATGRPTGHRRSRCPRHTRSHWDQSRGGSRTKHPSWAMAKAH